MRKVLIENRTDSFLIKVMPNCEELRKLLNQLCKKREMRLIVSLEFIIAYSEESDLESHNADGAKKRTTLREARALLWGERRGPRRRVETKVTTERRS